MEDVGFCVKGGAVVPYSAAPSDRVDRERVKVPQKNVAKKGIFFFWRAPPTDPERGEL